MRHLIAHRGGGHITLQDQGRSGHLAQGVSRGGAMDRIALAEGAALLDQPVETAALELAGHGGVFEATHDTRIALTGAPMRCDLGGTLLKWNASHLLQAGARMTIGGATTGTYGYLHVGGGFDAPNQLGAQSTHLSAGLGTAMESGTKLLLKPDLTGSNVGFALPPEERLGGGTIRVVPSLQTDLFLPAERGRFENTGFRRDPRSNRMGVRLSSNGGGFACTAGLSVLSEVIVPGDIQITGDGTPYVLMAECQTTGGYPRIGTVLPSDMARVAQATGTDELRFTFIDLEAAVAIERAAHKSLRRLPRLRHHRVRRAEDIGDLLAYQLISGVTCGNDLEPD